MTIQDGRQMVTALVSSVLGPKRAAGAMTGLDLADGIFAETAPDRASGPLIATALNIILFAELLDRVPTARRWVAAERAAGRGRTLDHGAVRTMRFPGRGTGALPGGVDAFARILQPLGYIAADVYPLPRLHMTGYAFRHRMLPADVPQFFVSELHVAQFDAEWADAAARVFQSTRDPLDPATLALLALLESRGWLTRTQACALLPVIANAFGRTHDAPTIADYEALKSRSAEAAWIATEGNAFNHATERVADVDALAQRLKAQGYPVKAAVEHSATGRVHQTAFRADPVRRAFRDADGATVERGCLVPSMNSSPATSTPRRGGSTLPSTAATPPASSP
jgi:hypothetical protein